MTLASAAFGFGQPLRPNLMFLVGVLALGRVLWWIRTLHIQIRRPRDHLVHVGFLSPPVFDRPTSARALHDPVYSARGIEAGSSAEWVLPGTFI